MDSTATSSISQRHRVAFRCLNVLWMMSCLSGLIYHMELVSEQYFSYSTTSEVTVSDDPQKNETIPSILLCNNLIDMLDQKRLTKDGFRKFNSSSQILKELSIEQALNYTHEYEIKNYTSHPVFIEYATTYSIWLERKCVQIVPFVKTTSKFWRRVLEISVVSSAKFKFKHHYYALNLKRTLNQMRSDYHPHYQNSYPIKKHLQYRYNVYKTVKPSTLINPCIEYSKEKHFKSRSYCLRQCEMIKSMKNPSLKYGQRFHYKKTLQSPLRMFPNIKNCDECPQECTNLIYVFSEPITTDSNHLIRISMYGTDPVIDILFSVKLSLIEYVIYIASCVGLWFGFSMFQSLFYFNKIMKKYLERKTKRKIAPIINNNLNLTLVYEPFLANRYRTMTNFNH